MKDKHCTSDLKKKKIKRKEETHTKSVSVVGDLKALELELFPFNLFVLVLTRSAVPGCLSVTGGKRVKE